MRSSTLITWLAASSAVSAYWFPASALNSTSLERRDVAEPKNDKGKPEGKPQGKPKPEPKPQGKPEPKPAAKPEPKPAAKPEPDYGGGGGGFGGGGGGGGGRGGGGGGGGRGGGERGGGGGGGGGGIIPGLPGIPFMPGGGGGEGPPPGMPMYGPPQAGKCPPIWFKIGKDLIQKFTAGVPGGQCNDMARAAIRIAFHDCGSWNMKLGNSAGCDGSLYLAREYTRRENSGLENVVPQFGQMAQAYGVGVADFFQFAGAHAVVTCPLGPTVQTFVGRIDRSTPNPEGLLPNPRAPAEQLVQVFKEKGINPAELAALLGAHSTSRQFAFDPARTGAALDSTPGVWDVAFYGETLKGNAPFILPSDIVLSKHREVGPAFKSFVNQQIPWNKAYSPAMTKMSLMGVSRAGLIDCTAALPPPKEKRGKGKA